jgi:hypothetical protein
MSPDADRLRTWNAEFLLEAQSGHQVARDRYVSNEGTTLHDGAVMVPTHEDEAEEQRSQDYGKELAPAQRRRCVADLL